MATLLCNREWLWHAYVDKHRAATAIAEELGVSKHSVYAALKRHGIETRQHTSKYPILEDEEWLRARYWDEKHSLNAIAQEVGGSPGVVSTHMKTLGISIRPIREAVIVAGNAERIGEDAANWQGGRKQAGEYIYVYSPDHPHATKQGYVLEHRLIAEKKLGRYLKPTEVVHHCDGNKTNNAPENLIVKKRSRHISDHFKASHEVLGLRQENAELKAEIARLQKEIVRLRGE